MNRLPTVSPGGRAAAATLALQALSHILADESLRQRFVELSGVSADDLRHGLEDDAVLGAILGFLANHEPDLIACAAALEVSPAQLMRSAELLQGIYDQ
jgi:hypothetical protein